MDGDDGDVLLATCDDNAAVVKLEETDWTVAGIQAVVKSSFRETAYTHGATAVVAHTVYQVTKRNTPRTLVTRATVGLPPLAGRQRDRVSRKPIAQPCSSAVEPASISGRYVIAGLVGARDGGNWLVRWHG